ncbi:hypothetical protein NP233_g12823 [Leucocoprinus birnbaumii]|uniref:F-box domain-containing protein n=1 Tax=Leucocoprinus birnbaumii TaxID=56174 RepID=A0AAD5YPM3_9AGAR|nr:hypothetical protein NP233_g12823 [Leucocoprinus birnbaumii]
MRDTITSQDSGPSAAQRCLSIPDILDLVCTEVWLSWEAPTRGRTLLALASTCRAWSEMPLNRICLRAGEKSVLKRPLTKTDKVIYDKYAWRVRRFYTTIPSTESAVIHKALSRMADVCIFPNLKSLEWVAEDSTTFRCIRYYLHRRLQKLSIGYQTPDQLSILFAIPSIFSQNLHHLQIKCNSDTLMDSHGVISHALSSWDNLSSLELEDVTFEGLFSMAEMRNLQHLKLCGLQSPWSRPSSTVVYAASSSWPQKLQALAALDPPFPALQSLHIAVKHDNVRLLIVTEFIACLRNVELRSLQLQFYSIYDTADHLVKLFRTVSRRCSESLQELYYTHRVLPGTFSIVFQPLLCFTHLKTLWVTTCNTIYLSEEEAESIVRSFPDIEKLGIEINDNRRHFGGQDGSYNPLSILLPFTACKKLKHLGIEIDASDYNMRQELPVIPDQISKEPNFSLQRLIIGRSPISHAEIVASFLADIFPNLNEITFGSVANNDHAEEWLLVDALLLSGKPL